MTADPYASARDYTQAKFKPVARECVNLVNEIGDAEGLARVPRGLRVYVPGTTARTVSVKMAGSKDGDTVVLTFPAPGLYYEPIMVSAITAISDASVIVHGYYDNEIDAEA
jgi:hypothetical protein